MVPNRASVELYSTRIPVDGWAGLPLLGVALGLVLVLPGAALMLLAGLAGGVVMAWSLIHLRRAR